MIFNQDIQKLPIAFDPELGKETAQLYGKLPKRAQDLVAGIAGSSPYLRDLLNSQHEWLVLVSEIDPNATFDAILADILKNPDIELGTRLRLAKKRVALLLAICDLSGIWPLETITQKLTEFADFATDTACKEEIAKALAKDALPHDILRAHPLGGLVVLAMGKMGAFELNYSSDIDLIFMFDDKIYPSADVHEIRAEFVKITRAVYKTLNERRGDGYVFRTDLRLRPNPSVTPVCPAMSSVEVYYVKEGRTWERSAFIKARACAGDIDAGNAFLKRLQNFIWRKNLDFAAMEDVQNILVQARLHKGVNGPITLLGHDMKMGRGGIREIEFFTQTHQLTYGGRDDGVRSPCTVDALQQLVDKERLDRLVAEKLTTTYRQHREIEHRIQMMRDAQTHNLPNNDEGMLQLANLSGYADLATFSKDVLAALETTRATTEVTGVANVKTDTGHTPNIEQQAMFDRWQSFSALRTDRAKDIFDRIIPIILQETDDAPNSREHLEHFDLFMSQLNSGVQLLSLFDKRPELLKLVMDICALSKPLARSLAQQTEVLDGLEDAALAPAKRDRDTYRNIFSTIVTDPDDLELSLNQIRSWHREEHFRIIVAQLRGTLNISAAERAFSNLAEVSVEHCVALVRREMERRYGKIAGSEFAVLAMGKLGSREMTCTSDLDIIVIFSGDPLADSDGKRALDTRSYYAKFTRTLISTLSASMHSGKLYDVDMRLRPSGRSGPVATSITSFEDYQKNKAWVWEHLALARSRVLAADDRLDSILNSVRQDVLVSETDHTKVKTQVVEMIERLRSEPYGKAPTLPVKKAPGGLLEIELLAQSCVLQSKIDALTPMGQLQGAIQTGQLTKSAGNDLIDTHQFLTKVEHLKRLLLKEDFKSDELSTAGEILFQTATDTTSIELLGKEITMRMTKARKIIDAHFGIAAPKGTK
ncbi:glutamate-ammonia-ligase adenylyltransferase [Amylibacter ulvae]|uniref:Glutamate-ammonia-ligase adenylyltransferase n=2 Tax=Paramylibacter ulvae TaxID=1651968 RepID=A0ABQ3D0S2_9RHOB|nr:glutamate-ammonia-ligase adenylyltransferase [Amylibacter ulvae]